MTRRTYSDKTQYTRKYCNNSVFDKSKTSVTIQYIYDDTLKHEKNLLLDSTVCFRDVVFSQDAKSELEENKVEMDKF